VFIKHDALLINLLNCGSLSTCGSSSWLRTGSWHSTGCSAGSLVQFRDDGRAQFIVTLVALQLILVKIRIHYPPRHQTFQAFTHKLPSHPSPIDNEHLAANVLARLACKEDHRTCKVLGTPPPPSRDTLRDLWEPYRVLE